MAAITVTVPANINVVDAPANSGTATINVDLREEPGSGGFFTIEVPAASAAGLVKGPITLTISQGS